jgi:DNA-binding LacI/PurR family transcriptional regulator
MSDVARHASVSQATVSRVLNGDDSVGSAYRRRVLRAVEELGYRPNRLAQNLRRQRTAAIGVVVSDIENPHFSGMVRAVEDQAYRRGYRVLVCNTDESADKQRSYLEALVEERVVGVIISPSDPSGAEIGKLLDAGIPIVAFDRRVADPRADTVTVDNLAGARVAVELLADGGHRQITFVSGLPGVESGAERLDGFDLSMRARGLTPQSVQGDFRVDAAERAVAAVLASPQRPSALIVGNNLMTIGALVAVRDAGLRIPADVALVGFDDPIWAGLIDPPLTTLAQPVRRMATEAMELLLERVGGARTEPRRTVHAFELRVRSSCGTATADGGQRIGR